VGVLPSKSTMMQKTRCARTPLARMTVTLAVAHVATLVSVVGASPLTVDDGARAGVGSTSEWNASKWELVMLTDAVSQGAVCLGACDHLLMHVCVRTPCVGMHTIQTSDTPMQRVSVRVFKVPRTHSTIRQ
jgi:hypothetical protein